jgi:hypothetical protein
MPKPIHISDGQILVGLDVVTSKAIADQMVVVKAADMADVLSTKGFIDLYGVYFDTDKTEVKSQSTAISTPSPGSGAKPSAQNHVAPTANATQAANSTQASQGQNTSNSSQAVQGKNCTPQLHKLKVC